MKEQAAIIPPVAKRFPLSPLKPMLSWHLENLIHLSVHLFVCRLDIDSVSEHFTKFLEMYESPAAEYSWKAHNPNYDTIELVDKAGTYTLRGKGK